MKLIEKLIENLDTVAAARSYVNVFQLRRGMDATLTANLIAQLFTGQGRQQTTGIGATPGLGTGTGAFGAAGTTQARPILTLSGNPSDGASLIDLRISVDDRSNSLIVAGSRNDLDFGVSSQDRFLICAAGYRGFGCDDSYSPVTGCSHSIACSRLDYT